MHSWRGLFADLFADVNVSLSPSTFGVADLREIAKQKIYSAEASRSHLTSTRSIAYQRSSHDTPREEITHSFNCYFNRPYDAARSQTGLWISVCSHCAGARLKTLFLKG